MHDSQRVQVSHEIQVLLRCLLLCHLKNLVTRCGSFISANLKYIVQAIGHVKQEAK
jgi:hypothetical protein